MVDGWTNGVWGLKGVSSKHRKGKERNSTGRPSQVKMPMRLAHLILRPPGQGPCRYTMGVVIREGSTYLPGEEKDGTPTQALRFACALPRARGARNTNCGYPV